MKDLRFSLNGLTKLNWKLGVVLVLIFGIPRFIIVLIANKTGDYSFTSIIFLLMWITPFILLTKEGRMNIGLKKVTNFSWLAYSFMLGIIACIIVYFFADWLYNKSISNWFVYISKSYSIPASELLNNKNTYFLIFAIIGMTFSPIGEELMYRGLIHKSFSDKFGENNASVIDSSAFAITHLSHFGIVYALGGWHFLVLPAMLWMTIIYLTGRLFFYCKNKTGSIYGAILAHAGFNLAMTYCIFYFIL